MSKVLDGATTSLNRQMSMIRFILRNSPRGVRFGEIDFHMTVNHGVSTKWTEKYLKKWGEWGVVVMRGTKLTVDENKWAMVQKARDEEFTLLEE